MALNLGFAGEWAAVAMPDGLDESETLGSAHVADPIPSEDKDGAGEGFAPPEECGEENPIPWLDRRHAAICVGIQAVSDRFDRFFDATGDEEAGETRVKLVASLESRERKTPEIKTKADARLDLPRLERRWNIFVQNFDFREDPLADPGAEEDGISTGLRLMLRQTPWLRVHADGGVRYSGGLRPFVRLRMRREFVRDPHLFRATQFFAWREQKGFSETTRLDYEQRFADTHLLHARAEAEWGEETDGLEWTPRIVLARLLRNRHGWALYGSVRGATQPDGRVTGYVTGARWRTRAYRDWLFFELESGLEYRRANDFRREAFAAFRVETIF